MFVWPTFGYFLLPESTGPPRAGRDGRRPGFGQWMGGGIWNLRGPFFSYKKMVNTVDEQNIQLTSWYGKYPIIYRVSYMSGGAGFLPSKACLTTWWFFKDVVWFFLPLYLLGETNGKRFLIWWQACFIQRGWNHQLVIFPRMTKSIDPDSVHYNI